MERILAADSGKHSTKLAILRANGEITKKSIRTKMDETTLTQPYSTESFVAEFEGKNYLIGDEAETSDFNLSKAETIHKVVTYAAIASVIDNGDEVNVATGCPLSIFVNSNERARYQNYLLPKGKEIRIKLNGSEKYFYIKNSLVLPESSGIIYSNPSKFSKSVIGVIDIGGLNANCCVYKNLAPVASTMFTVNLGSNIMMEDLKKKLQSEFSLTPIPDYMMEKYLTDGYIRSAKSESMKVISEYKEQHIQKLILECKKRQWDLTNMDIAFCGGTSLFLKNEIKKEFPYTEENYFSDDAAYLNALGFLKVLKNTLNR